AETEAKRRSQPTMSPLRSHAGRVAAATELFVERVVVDRETFAWQLVDELDRPRFLVRRDERAAVLDEIVLRRLVPVAHDDDGLDRLTPFRIRHADDRRFLHRRVLLQR